MTPTLLSMLSESRALVFLLGWLLGFGIGVWVGWRVKRLGKVMPAKCEQAVKWAIERTRWAA